MTLQAVRHGGRGVDFVWVFASAAAARLLGHHALDLVGQRLLGVLGGHLGHLAVFDQYRRVVESGIGEALRQVHVVNGISDVSRHGTVRTCGGVAVTLTNLNAVRRAKVLRLEGNVQRAVGRSTPTTPDEPPYRNRLFERPHTPSKPTEGNHDEHP